ncbi:uncharacterized protein LOC127079479 [Lathyrus oleraceus]|uniref:uncharacterized protein LOC127079479 n=1 Tax=Pisum sativum TaxID=3888 RepID=UPI0021CF8B2A|nr:uncharacterized protein LOC127079479 [Pisum sativum]
MTKPTSVDGDIVAMQEELNQFQRNDVWDLGTTVPVASVSATMDKTDQRKTYEYKLRDSKVDKSRKLSECLTKDYRVAFKQAYGNLLRVLNTKEYSGLIFTFAQFYDPTLHCFTFQDFLLAPTLDEFAHLLQLPVKNQAPYMIDEDFPDSADIVQALCMKKDLVEATLRVKGNTQGLPSKFLFENATMFANSGSWDAFYASFALLIYGLVLFPNVESFIDKTAITIFISQNPVSTLLADVFFSFHWRNMKKGGTITCCMPLLQKWIVSHLPKKGPFVDNVGDLKWSQRLMSLDAEDVIWFSLDYLRVELIFRCGEFPNVPLHKVDRKQNAYTRRFAAATTTTRHRYYTRSSKYKIMAEYEADNAVVRESLAHM